MNFKAQDDVFKRGRPAKYPWDLWTDGNRHTARKGLDFDIDPKSFAGNLYERARLDSTDERTVKVQTKIEGDSVYFRFYENQGGEQ